MKKVVSILLCVAFVLSTAACGNFGKTLNEQYADIVTEYEEKYGVITKERKIFCRNDALGGVSYIDLIDFNGDGTNELLIIFDENTIENDLAGALTCHIYAQVDNETKLVYDTTLNNSGEGSIIGCAFTGRTLCLAQDENKTYIVQAYNETKELLNYPNPSYNYATETETIEYDYDFSATEYLAFDGTTFNSVTKTGRCSWCSPAEAPLYMVDDALCSEVEYNNTKKTVTKHIECATFFYKDIFEHINNIKGRLVLPTTELPETTKSDTTQPYTTERTTTPPTTQPTPQPTTGATTSKKEMTIDEMANAIAAHYSAQRTDGGGFNVSSGEALDMGDYYSFIVRNKRSPEEEAEVDRLFREEGIIPSANIIAFGVTVEKATGKVIRDSDNDTWYLW